MEPLRKQGRVYLGFGRNTLRYRRNFGRTSKPFWVEAIITRALALLVFAALFSAIAVAFVDAVTK